MNKIKKVKLEANKIRIEYLVPVLTADNPDDDEHSLLCAHRARPSFYEALEALAPFVAEICEQPKEWAGTVEVKGISFSYGGENKIMGASISALKTLEKSNSPLKPSEPYSESGDTVMCLSDDATAALLRVQDEARAYLNGDRAQLGLNFDGEEEDDMALAEEASVTFTHIENGQATTSVTLTDSDMKKIGEMGDALKAPKKRGRPRKNPDAVAVATL